MSPPLHLLISDRASVAGVQLTPTEVDLLVRYYSLMERWNQKINLTALPLAARETSTIDRLIVEPLIAAAEVNPAEDLVWFDFGSGGGSPAIPLKVLRPRMSLTMMESRERKASFLREAISTLPLSSARVTTVRVEDLFGDHRDGSGGHPDGSVDLVTVRAVRLSPEILGTACKLLKLRGRVLVFQSNPDAPVEFSELSLVSRRSLAPSRGFVLTLEKRA